MLAEGSLKRLFRGNGTNCLKIGPEMALRLTVNDEIKQMVSRQCGNGDDGITPFQRMLIGGASGAVGQLFIYPMEVVRTRLAVCPEGTYKGTFEALGRIYQQEGLKALYRGLIPSVIGIIPYAGVDIAVFETLKGILVDKYDGDVPAHATLISGAVSASFAQFVSYPLAVVRTRLQAQGVDGGVEKYKGMIDTFRKTMVKEGIRGLYRGLTPNMLKLAPAAAISWWTFEKSKLMLGIDIRT